MGTDRTAAGCCGTGGCLRFVCIIRPAEKRHDYLKTACEIILRHRNGDNAAGIVRNIGRDGECAEAMTLAELKDRQVDMFTTVFIGNSQTKILGGKLITPRGYHI
jgi:precorrin-3B C17-methyltransferase